MKILIIGNGYIGTRCAQAWGGEAAVSGEIIRSTDDARQILEKHSPDVVLNAAGITGKPNVDWCETHQMETIKGNTILPLQIAEACQEKGIYLLHLGTGDIFYGPAPFASGQGWTESDFANPATVYTQSKYAADLLLSTLLKVGIARLRMPIDWRPHPANLIDKIVKYPKVVDVLNSISVMDDLVSALRQLLEKRGEGIFHTVSPGAIRHREIIDLYHKYVDPSHTNEWITEEELVAQGLAAKKRTNNIMSSKRLEALGIRMRPVSEAIEDTMRKYAEAVKKK